MTGNATRVDVDGAPELRRALKRMGEGLDDLKDANQRAASIVATAAGQRAPRKTGRLAGSGRGNRAAGRATVMFGGARAPYAGPIHYGWPARGIEAQPFILDAAAATEHVWLDAYSAELQQLADKVGGTY